MTSAPQRIVLLAPNWLGDAVMSLPALQSVRAAFPEAHLSVAARGAVAPLFGMVPGVHDVVRLESRGGLSHLGGWRRDAARLATERFDLAVLFPNSFMSAWTVAQAGVPERWGFGTDLRGRYLTKALHRPAGAVHQADYYLALIAAAGLTPAPRAARIDVPPTARDAATALVPAREFVVLAPGAAYGGAKQWPPERHAALARTLWRDRQLVSVMVGAGADRVAGDEVQRVVTASVGATDGAAALVNLIGRTDVPTLAAVLARAKAVVANDSGAMHLASAVGAPVVAIFGPTNEQQTAPLPAALSAPAARLAVHHVWCRPCMLRECPLGHMCMRGVSADDVAALIP